MNRSAVRISPANLNLAPIPHKHQHSNTVVHLPRLLGRPHAQVVAEDAHILRYHMFPLAAPADPAAEEPQVPLTLLVEQQQQQQQQQPGSNGSGSGSEGQERLYSPTELAGMLIGTLKGYQLVEGEDAPRRKFAFAVPKAFPPAHAQALLDAAQIAGLGPEDVLVTTATDALLATYRQKHPAAEFAPAAEGEAEAAAAGGGGGGGKTILLVDVGYAQTAVVVFSMGAEGFPRVLGEAYDAALGASNFDHRLFGHFAGEIAKKYGAEGGAVAPGACVLTSVFCLFGCVLFRLLVVVSSSILA